MAGLPGVWVAVLRRVVKKNAVLPLPTTPPPLSKHLSWASTMYGVSPLPNMGVR